MSEVVHYRGILTPIDIPDFETLEEECYYLQDQGYIFDYIEDDFYDSETVIKLDDQWYKINSKIVDLEEEIIELNKKDGKLLFNCKWYNGAASLKDVLKEGYDKYKSNL